MEKNKKLVKFVYSFFTILLACTVAFTGCVFQSEPIPDDTMFVNFIDVGQGDCTLIYTSNAAVLIDAGEAENSNHIIDFIKDKGIEKIDYCIATHPHSDHIGALPEVFKSFEVDTVIVPELSDDIEPTTRTYEKFLDGLENVNNIIFAVPGDSVEISDLEIEILGPLKEYDDLNHMSVVSKITFGNVSVMVTGDTETIAEKDMLDVKGTDYSADILKVAHHGSSTSTCSKWLEAVNPDYAVISCGIDNSYGHPHSETVDLLEEYEIDYYRTDLLGDIVFESDGKNITYVKQ